MRPLCVALQVQLGTARKGEKQEKIVHVSSRLAQCKGLSIPLKRSRRYCNKEQTKQTETLPTPPRFPHRPVFLLLIHHFPLCVDSPFKTAVAAAQIDQDVLISLQRGRQDTIRCLIHLHSFCFPCHKVGVHFRRALPRFVCLIVKLPKQMEPQWARLHTAGQSGTSGPCCSGADIPGNAGMEPQSGKVAAPSATHSCGQAVNACSA